MSRLEIKGFVEVSFSDWDGRVSTVVFLSNCNLRCPFCQNSDLVLRPGEMASLDLRTLTAYLRKSSSWIDGVVLTGGEPTLVDDLGGLAESLRNLGFPVKLDTNGTRPDVLRDLIGAGLVDYIAMDIKAPLDWRYERAAGVAVDLADVARSIDLVRSAAGVPYEFRTTLVPGIAGGEEVDAISRAIQGAAKYVLQQFVPDNCLDSGLRGAVPFTDAAAREFARRAGAHVKSCSYRGKTGTALSARGRPA